MRKHSGFESASPLRLTRETLPPAPPSQRSRILDSIVSCCAEKTYAETTIADIVARACVSRTTFYKLFSDKRDCFDAAVTRCVGRIGATLAAAVLGLVTTVGAAIGAHFQAGHYEALSQKYRETANSLATLEAEFLASGGAADTASFVNAAETVMQAEHAAWLTDMITIKT